MKIALFCLTVSAAFLNLSCGQNVESSPVAANEIPKETPAPSPLPGKYFEEIDVTRQFSALDNDIVPTSLEYKDFKIRRIAVRKKDEYDNPEAEIYDLVISKNGKTIGRFEGSYNPLGNLLGFGFYKFLNNSDEQLLIVDESNRYDREGIVSLAPKFEVIFDAADFEVVNGHLMAIDVDNDGEKEITLAKYCDLGFGFTSADMPWIRVIFKYDAKSRKYRPASHIFTDYTLNEQARRIQKFDENLKDLSGEKFSDFLEVFVTYIYAGKEAEAWRFFDETEIDIKEVSILGGKLDGKQQTKDHLKKILEKDPIYKFIRRDLRQK